jgi:hypothetical protein
MSCDPVKPRYPRGFAILLTQDCSSAGRGAFESAGLEGGDHRNWSCRSRRSLRHPLPWVRTLRDRGRIAVSMKHLRGHLRQARSFGPVRDGRSGFDPPPARTPAGSESNIWLHGECEPTRAIPPERLESFPLSSSAHRPSFGATASPLKIPEQRDAKAGDRFLSRSPCPRGN